MAVQSSVVLAAEFTMAGRLRPAVLTLNFIDRAAGQRAHHATFEVANKREARKLAVQHGATPWNF